MIVRNAGAADVAAITALSNALIRTTTGAWTEREQRIDERQVWLEHQCREGYPVLVADEAGDVIGFTSYGDFRGAGKWPGYRYTAEHSIHVREDRWGQGVGRALLTHLMDRGRDNGIHVMVAAIDGDNHASLKFHERLGFVEVARMPETGHKFGTWLELVLMQRILDPGGSR
jgi:phosphinothricin acetyltransferase